MGVHIVARRCARFLATHRRHRCARFAEGSRPQCQVCGSASSGPIAPIPQSQVRGYARGMGGGTQRQCHVHTQMQWLDPRIAKPSTLPIQTVQVHPAPSNQLPGPPILPRRPAAVQPLDDARVPLDDRGPVVRLPVQLVLLQPLLAAVPAEAAV